MPMETESYGKVEYLDENGEFQYLKTIQRRVQTMPIRVQNDLPAKEILERENIFVMDEHRAVHQDIRPLKSDCLI